MRNDSWDLFDPRVAVRGGQETSLARIFHELLSRDHEDGCATGQPSRGTAGLVSVPERYVAGSDTRGRQEGRPYPWSQQVIHEISGLNEVEAIVEMRHEERLLSHYLFQAQG